MNSRAKGKRVELGAAEALRSIGLDARRSAQYQGVGSDGDLIVEPSELHVEVKARQRISVYAWHDQARRDARGKTPILLMRADRRPFLAVVMLDDLPRLVELLHGRVSSPTQATGGSTLGTPPAG